MTIPWRYIVAAVLIVFAWKGSDLTMSWPPQPAVKIDAPKPPPAVIEKASPLRAILPKMLPKDRMYLAAFYDAMAYVLMRDGDRSPSIISTTDLFATFHAGSLRLAVDKASVGKYPGLAEAIDETIINIVGAEARSIDQELRQNLVVACATLSWSFGIGDDG